MPVFSNAFAFLAGTPAMVGLAITALLIYLTSDWRVSLLALLVQYLLAGLVLTGTIRLEVALAKMLVGLLVALILFLSARHFPGEKHDRLAPYSSIRFLGFRIGWLDGPLSLPLRFLSVFLVALALIRLFSGYHLSTVPMDIALVACWLGGMGFLGLVLSADPMRAATGVLTILTGFDLAYSQLEPSLAVAGSFGACTILGALAFSYLALAHNLRPAPAEGEEPES